MKRKLTRNLIVFAVAMAFVGPDFLSAATPTPSASSGASPLPEDRLEQLDEKIDSLFAQAFRGFGDWFESAPFSSSIDLREQKDKYVVRVYVPGSDNSKLQARVENNRLHLTAEGEQNAPGSRRQERYEQVVSLPGPVQSDKMRITRKKNLVVISLPKVAGSALAAATPSPRPSAARPDDFAAFDQAIINRMVRMQGRMEQLFRDAFPQDLTNAFNTLRLGSAVHLDDQKDQYVVRFYLPDRDLKKVEVKLEGGQLRLTAAETKRSDKNGLHSRKSGSYEQVMTLPGPVESKKMKVERENGTIVVTLPKA